MEEVATSTVRMIDEQLASLEPDGVRLWGSRCTACGTVSFPQQSSCPRCTSDRTERHALPREGRLWSWTIQRFPPKSPPYAGSADGFEPYGVGYIELGGELRVEAILTTADPAALSIGMPMRLVTVPTAGSPDGDVVTFAFEPAEGP